MNLIAYTIRESDPYYDFSTMKDLLKIDRSKLQRDLRRIAKANFIKYKNQHLYKQEVLFKLMEEQLICDLAKINSTNNGYE